MGSEQAVELIPGLEGRETLESQLAGTAAGLGQADQGSLVEFVGVEAAAKVGELSQVIARLVVARGAQDSAVEATKLSLERSREQLAETANELAKAKRGSSSRVIGKRYGLAGRRSRLMCRCGKLEEQLRRGEVRVCSWSARLARTGSRPQSCDYASHHKWRGVRERACTGGWFCQGDVGLPGGNPSARIGLSHLPLAHRASRLMGRLVRQVAPMPRRRYGGDNPVSHAWGKRSPRWPTLGQLGK